MKSILLYLLALFPGVLLAQLNGAYTIGGNSPDFPTITAAAAALEAQGVNGPVTLYIRDGVYEEQVVINGIPGASASNPVAFEGESQDSSMVIWEWLDGSISNNYVLFAQNLSYVYFKHLTMRRPTTGNNGRTIVVLGQADGVFFENCALIGSADANNSQESLVSASISALIEFHQCRLENGYEGILSAGDFNGPFSGALHVSQCTFVNQKEAGVFGVYLDHVWVTNSRFFSQNINGSIGVEVQGTDNASIITGNYFLYENTILSGNTAIQLSNQEPATNASRISNNMIAMYGGDGGSSGIRLQNIYSAEVYFNTVRIRKTPGYDCFTVFVFNCEEVHLLNNNFVAEGSPSIGFFEGDILTNDYNNYYTDPGINWLDALPVGPNSFSVDPNFLDATDLHIATSDLADAALPITNVTLDFDGDPRDPLAPDIGADEIQPFALDAGVLNVVSPVRFVPYCEGPPEVIVTLKNFGTDLLEQAEVVLEINNNVEATVNWTGSLGYLEEATVNFGTFPFVASEAYQIRSYTQAPNTSVDEFLNNDQAEFLDFHMPLSGTYTLGGSNPDFSSLSAMNANLINAGLCGPTTIRIRNGRYDDNIIIDTLPGASAVNTLWITSESGDSSTVVITDDFPSPYEQLIFLDEVSHVTISHLTLDDRGADLKDLVRFRRGHDLAITNCELIGHPCNGCAQTTEKGIYAVAVDSNLTIRQNLIYNNSDGFWLSGNSQTGTQTAVNFVVENNRVSNRALIINAARPKLFNNRFSGRFSRVENCDGFEIAHNVFLGGFALYTSTSFGAPSLFYNNALSHYEPNGASVSWDWALFINGASNVSIFHNTMKGAFNAGAVGITFSSDIELFNNIFYQSAFNSNVVFSQTSFDGVTSDYNVFFRNDLNDYILTYRQDFFGQDFHSYFIDPAFIGHPDSLFFPANGLMNNLAIPLNLEDDLFFAPRNLTYPDMGAVEYEAAPAVDLGPDRIICEGTALNALNPGSTYLWSDGSDGQTLEVAAGGQYWVQVSNALGTARDTVQIDILPTPELMLADQVICAGDTATLEAGLPDVSYLWSTGDTTATIEATSPGTYTLTATNLANCSDTDTLEVAHFPIPSIDWAVQNESCPGAMDGTVAAIVAGGQGAYTYAWAGNSTSDSLLANLGFGAYSLTLTDGNCTYTASTDVQIQDAPQAIILNLEPPCIYNAYPFLNGSAGADLYNWYVNDELASTEAEPAYSFSAVGDYTISLVAIANSCMDTASIQLTVQDGEACGFCIPYFSSGTTAGDFIDGVAVNQISNLNTGGTGSPAYQDYTGQQALLERGFSHTVSITSGAAASNRYAIWLDYNADGQFGPEELMAQFISDAAFTAYETSVFIPTDAVPASVRMRVRCFQPGVSPDPCLAAAYGETEDYTVNILLPDAVQESGTAIHYYPNPVRHQLYLDHPGPFEASVFGLDGQVLIPRKSVGSALDVGALAPGCYILAIWQEDAVYYWRFVKG